jgi:protein-L-isoaspartate(D-aspartate) O-methyltransferase
MNFELARFNMVEQQIRTSMPLRAEVRDLLLTVPRETFVPTAWRHQAFSDVEIPLGDEAAMFAPRIDARIVQALSPRKYENVLEIGTGSGYTAALLAVHADHVTSLEIRPDLAAAARDNLRQAGIGNVDVLAEDGFATVPPAQSYSVIAVSGAVADIPQSLLSALKVGGRLLAFVGQAPCQQLRLVTRLDDASYLGRDLMETVVAPLRNLPKTSSFRL